MPLNTLWSDFVKQTKCHVRHRAILLEQISMRIDKKSTLRVLDCCFRRRCRRYCRRWQQRQLCVYYLVVVFFFLSFDLWCERLCVFWVAVVWFVLLLLLLLPVSLLLLLYSFSSSVCIQYTYLLCALGSTHFNTQFRYTYRVYLVCLRRGKTKWPQSSNIKCTNLSIHNRRQASSVRFTSFP